MQYCQVFFEKKQKFPVSRSLLFFYFLKNLFRNLTYFNCQSRSFFSRRWTPRQRCVMWIKLPVMMAMLERSIRRGRIVRAWAALLRIPVATLCRPVTRFISTVLTLGTSAVQAMAASFQLRAGCLYHNFRSWAKPEWEIRRMMAIILRIRSSKFKVQGSKLSTPGWFSSR